MANITSFSIQSPYDQQMEELKRRQRMAELMQQEAMQPLESQVAPGGMVVPTSPVLGLAKLLQGYMSGKQLRDIEKQRGEAEQGARTEALDFLRSFSPERKTIGMGEAFGAGLPIPQISDKGQVSYQAPSVTAMPNARPVGSLDQPMQMQVGGPLGRRDQLARAEEGMFSSNPLVRALAQTKYEAASRPVNLMDYMDKPKLDTATPESVRAYTESIAQGAPDPSVLRYTTKPQPVSQATVMRNGEKVVIDANTGRVIGQAPAEYHAPEELKSIIGRDGKPIYVRASQAVGQTPYEAGGTNKAFGNENTLRDEYNNLTSSFRQVQDAYSKIKKTSDTGAGDMSLLYSYVKLLDPGSVVKEGEFETAASSGSFGQRIQNAVQRIKTGGRLEKDLRQSFINESASLYQAQKAGKDRIKAHYSEMAKSYGLDPSRVIVDYEENLYPRKTINGVTYENRGKGPNDWHKVEEQ